MPGVGHREWVTSTVANLLSPRVMSMAGRRGSAPLRIVPEPVSRVGIVTPCEASHEGGLTMKMLPKTTLLVAAITLLSPGVASAAQVDSTDLSATLGGSWRSQGGFRSELVKTHSLRPATCSAGRFTKAKRGRTTSYSGSRVDGYMRWAYTDVLTYRTPRAARRGLGGLKRWVSRCPGPLLPSCVGCDAGSLYLSSIKNARVGRVSTGWWSASPGGMEAVYTTSIAFVRGRKLGVASYRLYNTRDSSIDRSFVPSVQKTKAFAKRLQRRL